MNLNECQHAIRETAIQNAISYGYEYHENSRDPALMRAPLGKFECEPFYAPYFYESVLDGIADESLMCGEDTAGDVIMVSDDERIAFGLDPSTAFVVLWYSDSGFVSLEQMTPEEYDATRARFDARAVRCRGSRQ